jgi:hypothetical protein
VIGKDTFHIACMHCRGPTLEQCPDARLIVTVFVRVHLHDSLHLTYFTQTVLGTETSVTQVMRPD